MIKPPQTPEEARAHKYGAAAWEKRAYKETRCAWQVWARGRGIHASQCERAPGHGPAGLYCKQHAAKAAL